MGGMSGKEFLRKGAGPHENAEIKTVNSQILE